jgi:hypothetical protein
MWCYVLSIEPLACPAAVKSSKPENLPRDSHRLQRHEPPTLLNRACVRRSAGRASSRRLPFPANASYAAKIAADRPVNISTIERYVPLASDLPGLKFSTSLRASETNRAIILQQGSFATIILADQRDARRASRFGYPAASLKVDGAAPPCALVS